MISSTIKKLKKKWGIISNTDFFLIVLVFSLAGMTVSIGRKPIFSLIGISARTPLWIKVCVYIPLIIPLYQISLMVFGILLGQFDFFWKKQKQIGRVIKRLILPKNDTPKHTTSNKSAHL